MTSQQVVVDHGPSICHHSPTATDEPSDTERRLAESEQQVQLTAALLELIAKLHQSADIHRACITIVNDLADLLGTRQVAIGTRRRGRGVCRLQAISGFGDFDHRSELSQAIQSSLDEAILNDQVTVWLREGIQSRQGNIALKQAGNINSAQAAVSAPLHNGDGNAIGALLVFGDGPADQVVHLTQALRVAERPLASCLAVNQKLEASLAARLVRGTIGRLGTWPGFIGLLAFVAFCASMAIPMPYNVNCECQLEPVTRRYVVAPFEGTLEESLVKPGDLVAAGDVLAKLDAREMRWERAGLVADQQQAAKKRDAALASQHYGEAQIARLEMDRLQVQIQLLDHRAEHLEIRSPIDGIVTSGDWERAEGKPLEIGESMFEVAPLDKMIVEIAVPQDDIAYLSEKQSVAVRLDAYAGETFDVELRNIHPRSEIRDNKNVFIGEATLDNVGGTLQPGMNGRAKITTPDQPLGWILFHKPWETVQRWLGI